MNYKNFRIGSYFLITLYIYTDGIISNFDVFKQHEPTKCRMDFYCYFFVSRESSWHNDKYAGLQHYCDSEPYPCYYKFGLILLEKV